MSNFTPKYNHKMINYNFNNYVKVEDCLENIEKAYQQGRADRDREIAESNVFFSNRPIEDIVLEAIDDERERIVRELEENAYQETQDDMNPYPSPMVITLDKAIEIVRGEKNEFY